MVTFVDQWVCELLFDFVDEVDERRSRPGYTAPSLACLDMYCTLDSLLDGLVIDSPTIDRDVVPASVDARWRDLIGLGGLGVVTSLLVVLADRGDSTNWFESTDCFLLSAALE